MSLELSVSTVDCCGVIVPGCSIYAGKCLRSQRACGGSREVHRGAGVIDRHWPVVAGYVPIELVIVIEKARSVAYAVGNLNGARAVHRVGNVDFQVTGSAGS